MQAVIGDRNKHEEAQPKNKTKGNPIEKGKVPDTTGKRGKGYDHAKYRTGKRKKCRAVPGHRFTGIFDNGFCQKKCCNSRESKGKGTRERQIYPRTGTRAVNDDAKDNKNKK